MVLRTEDYTHRHLNLTHIDHGLITIPRADNGLVVVQCDHAFVCEVLDIESAIAARTAENELTEISITNHNIPQASNIDRTLDMKHRADYVHRTATPVRRK